MINKRNIPYVPKSDRTLLNEGITKDREVSDFTKGFYVGLILGCILMALMCYFHPGLPPVSTSPY